MRWLPLALIGCVAPRPFDDDPIDVADASDPETDPPDTDTLSPPDTDLADTDLADTDASDPDVPPLPDCGDGDLDAGEACDDGPANGATACGCTLDCAVPAPAVACDDADACTTDTCRPDGTCAHDGWDGTTAGLYDQTLLRDPSTLAVTVLSSHDRLTLAGVVRVEELRFTSYESEACALRPIRLEGWLATPTWLGRRPGLAVAHGLGGFADESAALGPAEDLGVVTLAWSGPGQGLSEGRGSDPDHLFDTLHIPRDSWLWEHSAAAIRALTLLETLPTVDPDRLAMTGYSGGGVATLMVNGVDDRLRAAVPVSATGHMHLAAATTPQPGWQVDLLADMTPPRTTASPEWQAYADHLDPRHFLATAHAPTLLINGAQDEFFPLHSTAATYADLRAGSADHRLLTIVDWDHGWFALFNDVQPGIDATNALQHWLRHHLDLALLPTEPPPQPELIDVIGGVCSGTFFPCAWVLAALPATGMRVDRVVARFSADGLGWASVDLRPGLGGWVAEIPTADPSSFDRSHLAWYVEATLTSLSQPLQPLKVTSAPSLPPGFQPVILPISGPLP